MSKGNLAHSTKLTTCFYSQVHFIDKQGHYRQPIQLHLSPPTSPIVIMGLNPASLDIGKILHGEGMRNVEELLTVELD